MIVAAGGTATQLPERLPAGFIESDLFEVTGAGGGDSLNLRDGEGTSARIVGRLNNGAVLRNVGGCRMTGRTRWCNVETTGGVRVRGWVSARCLREPGPGGGGAATQLPAEPQAAIQAGDPAVLAADCQRRVAERLGVPRNGVTTTAEGRRTDGTYPVKGSARNAGGRMVTSRKSWVEDRVRDADDAMDALAALCAGDARCAEAYDIPTLVDEAMALFDAGPIETTFTDPSDPATTITMTLTEADLASTIFEFQTGQIAVRSLPAILSAVVVDGRTSAAAILGDVKGAAILASRDAIERGMAMPMHMAVVCSDDPVVSADDLKIDPGARRYTVACGRSVLEEYLEFCRAVDAPPLPDGTDVDVTTDVPTLVLAGRLDARTPASRSEIVARALPHATLVTFPEGTHVQLGEINLCAGTIVEAFLAGPKGAPDTRCILDMPRRGFVLPDGATSAE